MRRVLRLFNAVGFALLLCATAMAQTTAIPTRVGEVGEDVRIETLQAKIKATEASTDLKDDIKAQLIELYRKAIGNLETASANTEAADRFADARKSAAEEAEKERQALERARKTPPEKDLRVSEQTAAEAIEPLLLKEKADLAAVEAKLAETKTRLAAQSSRTAAAQQRLVEAKKAQEDIAAALQTPAPPGEPQAVSQARRWELESRYKQLSAEIRKLDQELLSQPMRIDLLEAQRDRQANSVEWIQTRVRLLEDLLSKKRQVQAAAAVEGAEAALSEAEGKHPLVRQIAERNIELSDEIQVVTTKLQSLVTSDEEARKQAKALSDELRGAEQKLEVAGLNPALGQILVEQRRRLPSLASFRKREREREKEIGHATLRQIQHEEERERLRDTEAYIAELTEGMSSEEVDAIRGELQTVIDNRVGLLKQAIDLDRSYLRALGELDFAQRQLAGVVADYREFLGKNLLWLRSAAPLNVKLLRAFPADAQTLLSPTHWKQVTEALVDRLLHSPVLDLGLVVFAILVWKSRRIKAALLATGNRIVKPRSDRFIYTLQAFGLTVLLALPWPFLSALVGWQLGIDLEGRGFPHGVSLALIGVTPALFYLLAFRAICIPGGLAERHFRWSEESLSVLRREIPRLTFVLVPAALITLVLIRTDDRAFGEGLERLALTLILAGFSLFLYRLFEPKRGALQELYERHPRSLITRLRYLWSALSIGIPGALIVLIAIGYVLTAGILMGSVLETMWLLLGLVITYEMIVRWLSVIRRRIALEAAVEKRRVTREEEGSAAAGSEAIEVEAPELNLMNMDYESRQLLNTALVILGIFGVWFIWAPVLPAFGILDRVTLWHHTAVIEGSEQLVPVTLASIGIALLVTIITLVATKRLPALLEIILLQRLDMTPGGRYAATTLVSYLVAAVGAIWVFGTLGIDWSKLQWLVAALGVGIGFGLQEIVANFISGLIILFERPIRVGDVVTIGDTDGVVTRIQIRATTIRNWDRKELLVPNKEFITGRLLNWSLSDETTRVVIPVGVAYGTDAERAMELMLDAAKENEHIIDDPAPFTSFESFGDNALMLYLRGYLASIDYRLTTITELHTAINKKFNDAGIVIAFPQRDIHLDTTKPLDIRIQRAVSSSDVGDSG